MLAVRYYVAGNGRGPFEAWLGALDAMAATKAVTVLTRLEMGNLSNTKGVGQGVFDALLREGINVMLAGDIDTGKAILRDYIKATVGFEKLGDAIGTQPKSLIRMFGPRGNPQARNLFGVIGYLQKEAGVELQVAPGPE